MSILKTPFRFFINQLGRPVANKFSDPPILIGGCGRSGTTLLLSVLSAHDKLFCHPKELGIFNAAEIKEEGTLSIPKIHRFHQSFLFNKIPDTATRWCEKSPSNIKHISKIEVFTNNNFKFIQIIRDGRDVILSKHPTDPNRYWVDPDRWINDVSVGLAYENDSRVHTIRYEDLITDYDKVMLGICDFLEIEFTDELQNWHEHARVIQNRAYFGKVEKINPKSISKWQDPKYADRVKELMDRPEAVELLRHYNYLD